ncbi:hypothetical protein QE152_g25452 [Popillia japonica]|uniref:Uncharacterized protein n=1 Tax=Popillia japonica TaxID=7064 RepID=A0AAW1K0I7_POPJA
MLGSEDQTIDELRETECLNETLRRRIWQQRTAEQDIARRDLTAAVPKDRTIVSSGVYYTWYRYRLLLRIEV